MMLKCVSCYHLYSEVIHPQGPRMVYDCWQGRLPYTLALSGLLRPGKGTTSGAEKCPEEPRSRCVVCQQTTDLLTYGDDNFVSICQEHDAAWGKWLDEHPERRAYLAPRQRVVKANWIEVFREFIEDMRWQLEGEP